MTLTDFALISSVVAIGLFAGLMMTLVIVLQRMWQTLPDAAYVEAMQSFLPVAKGNPVITLITLLPILLPIVALIDRRVEAASSQFFLILIGLILACGPLLVTLRFNFPVYDTMMGWQAIRPPRDLSRTRTRFFMLNLARLILASGAMLCFLLALMA
jgi:uncharacterized membrane protein